MLQEMLLKFHMAAACGTTPIFPGGPSLYDTGPGLTCSGGEPVISSVSGVLVIVGNVVRILIAASGGLAVIVIIVASIYYITSTGEPSRIKRAKDILTNTAVGLVIILCAYAVITYIASKY